MRFYNNTDTVDINNKSLGVSNDASLDNRGLKISINHNGQKDQFETACKIQRIIVDALNKANIDHVGMKVSLDQVTLLNKRIGDTVYALDTVTGLLVAASLPKRYIREHHLDDMINSKGQLTDRAILFAKEILS